MEKQHFWDEWNAFINGMLLLLPLKVLQREPCYAFAELRGGEGTQSWPHPKTERADSRLVS